MANIDYSMLKGLREAKFLRTERRILEEVVEVIVLSDVTVFEEAVTELWDLYNMKWGVYHDGVPLPVSSEELVRYCYTAVKARVSRVNNTRFHVRCDDSWAVPTPIAAALSGIGIVNIESPIMRIVPKWNEEHDDMVMEYAEWHRVSQKLRAIERDPDAKILFARAIAGDKNGDEVLLNLIPVRDELGRMVELRSYNEFDPIAGFVYLLMGLYPSINEGLALPSHPLLMPPVFLQTAALRQFMFKYIEAGAA
jgi:hypothetical protein